MNDSERPVLTPEMTSLFDELRAIRELIIPHELPRMRPIHFTPEKLEKLDDKGPPAASYGVYNPVAARVYLGLNSPQASRGSSSAFVIPGESAVILPWAVSNEMPIGIDAVELGASNATVWVMRFLTIQPFFLASL